MCLGRPKSTDVTTTVFCRMLLAKRLGLMADSAVDWASLASIMPNRLPLGLSKRGAIAGLKSMNINVVASVDEDICSGFNTEHKLASRIFKTFLLETGVGRGGLSSLTVYFFLIGLARPYRFWRIAIKLPSRNQRSRSNAKTAARLEYEGIKEAFALLGIARVAIGREAGASAHKQKIKAKLKPKVIKTSTQSSKKKPVIRSRDTKKSAWR